MSRFALLSLVFAVSCGPARYVNPQPVQRPWVAVRVESDALLNATHVSDACDVWAETGAECLIVAPTTPAKIVVSADYQRCPSTNGGKVFAVAEACRITVFMDCFLETGILDRPLLRRILAHELGHAFGIDHVARECEPGRRICGEALMNAMPELSYVTAVDARALEAAEMRCKLQ